MVHRAGVDPGGEFSLTGGTALAALCLHHRYSVDLDLFTENPADPKPEPLPWHGIPPDLETYRWRGHRRLSARTYSSKCTSCIWGCRMAVEMIIDPWNPKMRYRFETFCYGPRSCPYYKAGPRRVVPGRKGMRWEEPDWVDEQATTHRGMDE